MSQQLTLALEKEGLARFENFDPKGNAFVLKTLRDWPPHDKMIYLDGPTQSGKTHLAEALAGQALSQGQRVLFLSGKLIPAPHFFYDLPEVDYFILDDVDYLLQFSSQYEEALFSLYNQIFDMADAHLLLLSTLPIAALPLKLKDLKSRLKGMHHLHLRLRQAPCYTTPQEKT